MSDLFSAQHSSTQEALDPSKPLAVRRRPQTMQDFFGQEHLMGAGKPIRRMIETDKISSMIFFGPPGTGKTTLARIISKETKSYFQSINAVSATVADLRKIIDQAKQRKIAAGQRTILFIDEIHRFSKTQQDVLMPDVENANPILIGATTENPFFSINPALISRVQIYELKSLSSDNIIKLLKNSLNDQILKSNLEKIECEEGVFDFIARISNGDARSALNFIELTINSTNIKELGLLTIKNCEDSLIKRRVLYDKSQDQHYDTISAFIKSMRGSDANAAIYYLAKMLYAGEDPRFIARRMLIFASEDVGNAEPMALSVAAAAYKATEVIGMPEVRINLAQAVTFLACCPKSNASYVAIEKAMADVESGKNLEVPSHLQDGHYKGSSALGRGQGYIYPHDEPNKAKAQKYLAEDRIYYIPKEIGFEKKLKETLENLKNKSIE